MPRGKRSDWIFINVFFLLLIYRKRKFCAEPMRERLTFHFELRTRSGNFVCSTMGVGCQSRRFNCLFWRETRQRIFGHEISPYPEVVRRGEWELTTRPRREGVSGWRAERQAAEERLAWKNGGAVNTRHRAERRGGKIGSSEEESQDVWSQ